MDATLKSVLKEYTSYQPSSISNVLKLSSDSDTSDKNIVYLSGVPWGLEDTHNGTLAGFLRPSGFMKLNPFSDSRSLKFYTKGSASDSLLKGMLREAASNEDSLTLFGKVNSEYEVGGHGPHMNIAGAVYRSVEAGFFRSYK